MKFLPFSNREAGIPTSTADIINASYTPRWLIVLRVTQFIFSIFCFAASIYIIDQYGRRSQELLIAPIILLLTTITHLVILPIYLPTSLNPLTLFSQSIRSSITHPRRLLTFTTCLLILWTLSLGSLSTSASLVRPLSHHILQHIPYASSKFKDMTTGPHENSPNPEFSTNSHPGDSDAVPLDAGSSPALESFEASEAMNHARNHLASTASGTLGLLVEARKDAWILGVVCCLVAVVMVGMLVVVITFEIDRCILGAVELVRGYSGVLDHTNTFGSTMGYSSSSSQSHGQQQQRGFRSSSQHGYPLDNQFGLGIHPANRTASGLSTASSNDGGEEVHPGTRLHPTGPSPRFPPSLLQANMALAYDRGSSTGALPSPGMPLSARRARFGKDVIGGGYTAGHGGYAAGYGDEENAAAITARYYSNQVSRDVRNTGGEGERQEESEPMLIPAQPMRNVSGAFGGGNSSNDNLLGGPSPDLGDDGGDEDSKGHVVNINNSSSSGVPNMHRYGKILPLNTSANRMVSREAVGGDREGNSGVVGDGADGNIGSIAGQQHSSSVKKGHGRSKSRSSAVEYFTPGFMAKKRGPSGGEA